MIAPGLLSWIEKRDDGPVYGIERGEVCSFAPISFHTSENKVVATRCATMYQRNIVINLVRQLSFLVV